jgi:hypothetical protein
MLCDVKSGDDAARNVGNCDLVLKQEADSIWARVRIGYWLTPALSMLKMDGCGG